MIPLTSPLPLPMCDLTAKSRLPIVTSSAKAQRISRWASTDLGACTPRTGTR